MTLPPADLIADALMEMGPEFGETDGAIWESHIAGKRACILCMDKRRQGTYLVVVDHADDKINFWVEWKCGTCGVRVR